MSNLYKEVKYKNQRGTIYAHRLIAENKIGRKLKKGEIVHHIDENKNNNDPNNLIVFVSRRAHVSHHKGNPLIKTNEKYVYDCEPKTKDNCLKCGKELYDNYTKNKLCSNCYHISQRKVERPTKEQLINDIKEMSMVKVGKKYNVSDNAIRKWCKWYNI